MKYCVSLIFAVFFSVYLCARELSPLNYGLRDAKTGVERYHVLLRTHQDAVLKGCGITYKGIDSMTIEIPDIPEPIPLSYYTDFAGVELTVVNKSKRVTLFVMDNEVHTMSIIKSEVDRGRFYNNTELEKGHKLLVIQDLNPWVVKRKGHDYGATRQDILLLKNGIAVNRVIQPYSNLNSKPHAGYYVVDDREKVIENLHIIRSSYSQYVTNCISITGENNVVIRSITIDTPPSTLNSDRAIVVRNSTNVRMEDVTINGTYSQINHSGYGISMNNVFNSNFVRLKATGNWGVFGNNNINTLTIVDSDINRFDIHCYGKDVYCKNTVFRDLYNQISSFYGTFSFEGCRFIHFVPILFESSYAAYTFFDLVFKDCEIEVDPKRHYLIKAGKMEAIKGSRKELTNLNWPNLSMKNVSISADENVSKFTLFQVGGKEDVVVRGINMVEMSRVVYSQCQPKIYFSNKHSNLANKLKIKQDKNSFDRIIIK